LWKRTEKEIIVLKGRVLMTSKKEFFDELRDVGMFSIGLCPNSARQGQKFPNISKRNQKLVKKVVQNQLFEIMTLFNFKNPALQIRMPRVGILPCEA
jgi:hypothetical protein